MSGSWRISSSHGTLPDQYQPVPVLQPELEAVAELGKLRKRDLTTISDRLGRMSKRRWDRWFGAAFLLFLGSGLTQVVGLVPFYSGDPSHKDKVRYFLALAAVGVLSLICGLAALAVKSERDDSVAAIKHDVDTLLGAYPKSGTP